MTGVLPWRVAGSYFEACSCEAVCPCRREGDRMGGRSTYGVCDFALSWLINEGRAGDADLSGLTAVMAGSYNDDEQGSPWRVALYIDERADEAQFDAISDVFLGRAGGSAFKNFASAIGEVYAVHRARILLDHAAGSQSIDVPNRVNVRAAEAVAANGSVTCGIPGYDQPGQELRMSVMRVGAAADVGAGRALWVRHRLRLPV